MQTRRYHRQSSAPTPPPPAPWPPRLPPPSSPRPPRLALPSALAPPRSSLGPTARTGSCRSARPPSQLPSRRRRCQSRPSQSSAPTPPPPVPLQLRPQLPSSPRPRHLALPSALAPPRSLLGPKIQRGSCRSARPPSPLPLPHLAQTSCQ